MTPPNTTPLNEEDRLGENKNTDLNAMERIRIILDEFYPEARVAILEYCLFIAHKDEES